VAEGGGLLNRYRIKSSIGGSNPPLSAIYSSRTSDFHLNPGNIGVSAGFRVSSSPREVAQSISHTFSSSGFLCLEIASFELDRGSKALSFDQDALAVFSNSVRTLQPSACEYT
jgi:hypothetical protein